MVRGVSAGYRDRAVVRNIDLDVEGPGIFMVIGPNGSGKSTLLRVIAGIVKPYSGEVIVNGVPIYRRSEVKRVVGYMPADIGLLPRLTLYDNLRVFAELLGYDKRYVDERLEVLRKYIQVDDILYMRCGAMSTGQRIRAGLIRTLIHDPQIVILDEPTRGLDVAFARDVRSLIQGLARDRLVIMTTHLVYEVLDMGRDIAVLRSGELVFRGSIDEFRRVLADKPVTLYVKTTTSVDEVLQSLDIEFVRRGYGDYIVRLPNIYTLSKLLRELSISTNIIEFREDLDELVKTLYGG
ncbi:ABC transporter related [Ignisphaera aggregans DSM 17230]|uniref:ABC transporter related n=1 Tax=Ignisphaera aggregans (strain DSM 17230 / JCM 13409 / AQ1.S1) TaxID=583356 RepID=E0STA4_IGNAA|nr:ABC transporter related [Ignisphaera aggregans DSM 17230]